MGAFPWLSVTASRHADPHPRPDRAQPTPQERTPLNAPLPYLDPALSHAERVTDLLDA
ncbi:hypothetical protein HFP72_00830 [Nocardiopsis sp. ARC36]